MTLRTDASSGWISHLLRGIAKLGADRDPPYHLCLARSRSDLSAPDGLVSAGWEAREQWMWQLATVRNNRAYPVTEQNRLQLNDATRSLSGDWDVTVMRNGACFLAKPLADDWSDAHPPGEHRLHFLAERAPLLVRTLNADALVFGFIKGLVLRGFARELAELGDPVTDPNKLRQLEGRFTLFRNTLWWQEIGLSGHATLLLRRYESSHGHEREFVRLVADFADYSQKIERLELQRSNEISQITNALIGLVTCIGVPLAALQVFGTQSAAIWIAVAVYLALLSLLPAGQAIIAFNLPRRLRDDKRGPWTARGVWAVGWLAVIGLLLAVGVLPPSG